MDFREILLENYPDEDLLLADGFDDAVIGVAEDFLPKPRVIYSVTKCIKILMERDGMTDEEAFDHFTYNVSGGWVGEQTPIWCWDDFLE